jgi:myo-inositol-1-phosphate synthase
MIYAYAAIREGIPYANGAPNLSALQELAAASQDAHHRQGPRPARR